jgi:hypothetical protein
MNNLYYQDKKLFDASVQFSALSEKYKESYFSYGYRANNNSKDSKEQIHTGIYGTEWTALAAETIGGVNTVLWQHESGALHTWLTDANWQWVGSDGWWELGSAEYDTAESNFGIDANKDGIIGALSSIEPSVCEVTDEEIVPVIIICWLEEDLNQLHNLRTKDIAACGDINGNMTADFEIGLVGVTSIATADFVL